MSANEHSNDINPSRITTILLSIIAICGWFALSAQLYLILVNRVAGIGETLVRYFSFFTILTNLLVAIATTFLAVKISTRMTRFFSDPVVLAAITLYITVVGLIYNLILRSLWNPKGLQKVTDELLHSVIPLLFIIFWMKYAPKKGLAWKNVPLWLIYPSVYATYLLIRGAVSGFYPYPFVDVNDLGYQSVLINVAGMVGVFLAFSLAIIILSRFLSPSQTGNEQGVN